MSIHRQFGPTQLVSYTPACLYTGSSWFPIHRQVYTPAGDLPVYRPVAVTVICQLMIYYFVLN